MDSSGDFKAVAINMKHDVKKADDEINDINGDAVLCCKRKSGPANGKKKIKFTFKQKLSLVMLALADFMSCCSMSILAPFYPAESSKKGMSESTAGLVFGYYALVVFLASPVFGKVLPKFGAKNIFIIGLFLSGVSGILFGFIGDIEDYSLFVALSFIIRTFIALGSSAYSTAGYVLIINIFPDNSGGVRGILETFVGLGLCAGPGIGGLLYTVGGFGLPFYVTGIILIFIAFLNIFLLAQPERNDVEKRGSLLNLLKLPPILVTCVIMIMTAMNAAYLEPTLEPHLRKFNLNPTQVGLLFLMESGTYGIFSPLWGLVTDKSTDYTWLMTTGLFCSSIVLLFLGPSPIFTFLDDSTWLYVGALPALGVFVSMALIPTYQFMLDSSMENGYLDCLGTHSIVAGLWISVYSLGEVIGPVLAGTLMENFGFPTTSSTFAFLNFVGGVTAMIYFKTRNMTSKVVLAEKKCVDNIIFYVESTDVHKSTSPTATTNGNNDNVVSIRL